MPMVAYIQSCCSANGMAESSFSGPGPVPMARSVVTPAARARSSMASRSSANCGKSMCACESISSMCDLVAQTLLSVRRAVKRIAQVRVPVLLQAGADFYVFVGEACKDGTAIRADRCGDNHAVGLHSPQLARREIHNHGDFAPDQFFWLVILRNARANLPDLRADVHGE